MELEWAPTNGLLASIGANHIQSQDRPYHRRRAAADWYRQARAWCAGGRVAVARRRQRASWHRYDGGTVAAAVERTVDAARRTAAPRRDPTSDLLGRDRARGPRPPAAAARSPAAALRRRRRDLLY